VTTQNFAEALREHRQGKGLSLRDLASKVHCSHAHIADMEAGRRRPGMALVQQLDAILAAGGSLTRLAAPGSEVAARRFTVRSHKFIAAHIAEGVLILPKHLRLEPVDDGILDGHAVARVSHPAGEADLHVWAHGSVVLHLVEVREWQSLTDLTAWRYDSYESDMKWLSEALSTMLVQSARASHVLSVYWLLDPPWPPEAVDTATRLLCMPRVLHGSEGAEERILREGFPHQDLEPFGVVDASIAYASWAGVSYHPLDPNRGLSQDDISRIELAAQSLWVFCAAIAAHVERGDDPVVGDFGWRWLRAARSRIMTARPQETTPHRSMREAILKTSGLPDMLDEAIQILREVAP